MIIVMRLDHETAAEWYERAIVADSLAAEQDQALIGEDNPTAIRLAHKRAEEAADEVLQALAALQEHRRLLAQFHRR